jgi:microcystin-dependent protein
MTGVAWWSQTAAANASSDSAVGWAEGMAPSSVNDSSRAEMASVAKWRDDISGAIATGGTSTAYTVASYQSFDTLARLNGQMIAFTPHATNGATVQLNVDGLGAKPLRSAPSVELPAGVLIQGTPYVAIYNSSDAAFYLQGFYGNPYAVPIGGFLPYSGTTAPNSNFVLPYGQAISRTTYSSYFALVSTTFGSGDGSTTFNLPDLRGRVVAGADGMGGVAANRLTDAVAGMDSLGDAGGAQSHTLSTSEMPAHSHGVTDPGHNHNFSNNPFYGGTSTATPVGGGSTAAPSGAQTVSITIATTGISIQNNGGGGAHNNVQPTIVLNYLLRVI